MIDKNLFIKKSNSEIILVQIYVNDIIFGATKDSLCEEFVVAMQGEFEMSMMGGFHSFLDCRSSNQKMEFSYVNQSIAKKFLRSLKWKVVKKLTHLCHQVVVWILMWLEKR